MTLPRVPGPANGPFGFRHIYSLKTRPLEFYERLAAYGDIATFRMWNVRAYLLNSPDLIHQVLRDTGTRFRKLPRTMGALSRGLGRGLLVAEGDDWLAARRLVQPSFTPKALEAVVADAVPCVDAMLERWSQQKQVELFTEMNRLTVDVASRVILKVELEEETLRIGKAARALAETWDQAVRQVFMLPLWFPLAKQKRERAAIAYLRTLIHRIINRRLQSRGDSPDLLGRLVEAYSKESGDPTIVRERLVDQVLTLFVAAYHASTVTLCWTLYLLARHPTIHRQVLEEIEHEIGTQRPHFSDLQRLSLTRNTLQEAMRLYPSAWEMFPREALEDTQLGPWPIPQGAWLFTSPYVTHRDGRFFSDPHSFDPARWAPDRVDEIVPHAYFPFGGGRHLCVGKEMAMLQNTLMLAMILRDYRLSFGKAEHVPHPMPPMALMPKDPMHVQLERRSVSACNMSEYPEFAYSI